MTPARAAHRKAVLAARKPPAMPAPMGVDPERAHVCDQCGDIAMLCAADPLPAGWVAVGVGRGTRYLCELHAGEATGGIVTISGPAETGAKNA